MRALGGHGDGLQLLLRAGCDDVETVLLDRTVREFALRSTSLCVLIKARPDIEANDRCIHSAKALERVPLMQHVETAEFSLEAGEVLSSSEFPDRHYENVIGN